MQGVLSTVSNCIFKNFDESYDDVGIHVPYHTSDKKNQNQAYGALKLRTHTGTETPNDIFNLRWVETLCVTDHHALAQSFQNFGS